MEQRANLKYPPFTRLVHLTIKHKKEALAAHAAQLLSTQLKASLAERVLGPTPFFIPRLMNYYLFEILLKIERNGIDGQKLRAFINTSIDFLETIPELKGVEVLIDVDPA
jgi:primosomal protein N' (replication factor Y)